MTPAHHAGGRRHIPGSYLYPIIHIMAISSNENYEADERKTSTRGGKEDGRWHPSIILQCWYWRFGI